MGDNVWKAHLAKVLVQLFDGGYHVITQVALKFGSGNVYSLCFVVEVGDGRGEHEKKKKMERRMSKGVLSSNNLCS
ncbi:hypothetical protein RIF29_17605 [Crotalaria pallida]|uniref:Uncharacterized protein n=1 Tax=Crotalaria pallida TaxID=3830 RepID=A0AAN9FKT7_CROPI